MSDKATSRAARVRRGGPQTANIEEKIRARLQEYGTITAPAPTVLTAAASLWDFAGVLTPRVRLNPRLADKPAAQSLAEAWAAVGRDMRTVLPPPIEVRRGE